jgi:HTH-type transcriptional repressor of NAD biosynthesis genes
MEILEMKKYKKALVIGKFMPLHKGHIGLINFACENAEIVLVCVLAHRKECIPLDRRVNWVKDSMYAGVVSACGLMYDADVLNSSSNSDIESSIAWAEYLKNQLEDFESIDVVVGSELYVKFIAEYLGIQYLIYDDKRLQINISATTIKNDVIKNWDYLAPSVKRTYAKHICICGSESTGKTTVCNTIERECEYVTVIPEIGRCIVGKSELCSIKQLCEIYDIHYKLLEVVVNDPPTPFVLWDTDNLTTLSYVRFLFPDADDSTLTKQRPLLLADKYFFFESNIKFVDDNTRLNEETAQALRNNHIITYQQAGVLLEQVTNDRLEKVKQYLYDEIETLKNIFN